MKIKNRLIILFILITLIPFSIVSYVSFTAARKTLQEQVLNELKSTADSRISDITHLIQLRQEQCKMLAGTFLLRQLNPNGKNNPETIANIQAHIESIYKEMKQHSENKDNNINKATAIEVIGVWDKSGTIVANNNTELIGQKMPDSYIHIVKNKGAYFAGYQTDPLTKKDYLIFLQSIRNYKDNKFAGAVLLKVKAQILNEITTNVSGLGKTGEVLVGQLDGNKIRFITSLRHYKIPQSINLGSNIAIPLQEAIQGNESASISTDYRGVEVLAVYKYIPDLKWGFVAKIDLAEAYEPIYSVGKLVLIIGLFILAITVIIAVRIAIFFSRPISQAAKLANGVALGNMTEDVNLISRAPEINELGESLTRMQKNMQEVTSVALAASKGDYNQSVEVKSDKDLLAIAINKMMKTTTEKLWLEKGRSEMNTVLRGVTELNTIAEKVINKLVPYLQAQVGAFYLTGTDDNTMRFTAGYAFKKKGRTNYDIKVGEGLTGQAAKEKKIVMFTDIPEDYLKVNSGLGESTPKNIIAVPLIANGKIVGAIEIGSVNEITNVQIQLLEIIAPNIAIAINAAVSRIKIQELLNISRTSEEELIVQHEELERIQLEMSQQIDTMNEAALVSETDPEGNITFVNDKFCEISGYSYEELMGKNHRILKSGKQPDDLFVDLWKTISMGRVWKGEILNKIKGDRGYFWVDTTIMPYKNIEGKIIKYVAIRFDITKQKELQHRLEQQAEELKEQQEELQGTFEELQAQAEELKKSKDILEDQKEEINQYNNELEEKQHLLIEKNKAIIEKNTLLETARKELETKAMELVITSKYKSEFLANMSHELRTPLNSIILLSKLLKDNKNKTLLDKEVEFATVIHNSGNGLLELINEILDMSKVESGKMELEIEDIKVKDIKDNLLEIFNPQTEKKKFIFEVSIARNAPKTIRTDKLRIEQILKNLLSNAFKFTEEGKVELSISTTSKKVKFRNENLINKKVISFAVKDTGIGIPLDKFQTVFEAFKQVDGTTVRKYGGTGLGLAISYKLANYLGGEIQLESQEGKGSTFTLFLPVELNGFGEGRLGKNYTDNLNAAVENKNITDVINKNLLDENFSSQIIDDREKIKKKDKVILIVDDDISLSKVIIDFIHENGFKGIIAVNGTQAISFADKYIPYGILLDIKLLGMDGWSVMKKLKKNPKTAFIPVYIISSTSFKKESIESGAIDFLSKPIDKNKIDIVLSKLDDLYKNKRKRILIIEDNVQHSQAISEYLSTLDLDCVIANTAKKGLKLLEQNNICCIILDMGLPDTTGYEVMEIIRKKPKYESMPILVYTGKSISKEEEAKINKYADTIIIKTAESYNRLSEEISTYLHVMKKEETKKEKKQIFDADKILENKNILIVDDDMRNVFALTGFLENLKMNVFVAENGKKAIDTLKNKDEIDLVLMDIMMPEMDGFEAMRKIRKIKKLSKIPIIALTAKAMLGDRAKCIEAGASDYISKPVDIDQLISLLRVWLYK